tara:strand:- start:910 stop:1470 length:561 start_codon:yes stop_codon:yes gene_type:complete
MGQADNPLGKPIENKAQHILIVYLSQTNNTRAVAQMIQKKTGGEMTAIELQDPYPENYQEIVAQVAEENETGFLPPLQTKINNLDHYDTVFIGFPTWGMQLPPPIKSFLTTNNLSGKTVIPFNTNAGYGLGSTIKTINKLCSDSKVLEAFSVEGGIERDGILFVMEGEKAEQVEEKLDDWLAKIDF